MPELLATIEGMRERTNEDRRFQIALAGGDPDDSDAEFEKIREQERLRAAGMIDEDTPEEVANAIAAGNVYFVE